LNKRRLHIVLSGFLIANLLFSQIVINLLHDRHDAHEATIELPDGKASIQKHGEHCKVCSLDIHFKLFKNNPFRLAPQQQDLILTIACVASEKLIPVSFSQDRAPPVLS
jgi:hypothetical protein